MRILKTYARAWVQDLGNALPFYEAIVGKPADLRFPFEGAELAAVGDFLLISGPSEITDRYRDTIGPVIVDDLDALERDILARGAVAVAPRSSAPTGEMLYARHPDGVQVEYVQWTPELMAQILPVA